MKKLFTLFLALVASVGTMFAESGTCGDNLTWDLTDGVLTISGTGPMTDYYPSSSKPWNKSAIREIIISDGCTSIGNNIFEFCSNLTSVTISNSVTSIGTGSFDYCGALTSVNIPNSVTTFKDYAFRGCSAMTAITIPNSVSYIEEYAFESCNSLISIEIPRGNIGNMAFANCQNLSSVIIGEGVTAIYGSDGPFYGCTKLKTVVWNAQNAKCTSSYGSEYELNPFRGGSASSITSFTFGENVRNIPSRLCYGMSNLTSITIPKSVTSVGDYAFEGCSNLTTIVWNAENYISPSSDYYSPFYWIREQITSFTFGNSVNSIPAYLCYRMSSLTSVTIPNSITSIGDDAFYDCSSMTSLNISNSVKSIGVEAFRNCTRLTSLTIPNSVISIEDYAFSWCSSLTSFSIPNPQTQCGNNVLVGAQSLTSLSVPASALNISESSINSVTSHLQSLTVIGGEVSESGFLFITHSYRTLQTLDLGAATNTTLADEAFKGCYNLQSLVLPQNLTNISYMAVADCKNLQSIDIPASVTEISQSAFENCRSLKTITFGGQTANAPGRFNAHSSSNSQLQRIGNWAFYNCHELQNLTIPEGVIEIGDGAFYGCTYLENLSLPASMQSIGDNTFALCAKMEQMVVNAVTPPAIQAKTFFDVKRQIPVYVPDEVVDTYLNDALWSEFDIQGISHMPQAIENTHIDEKSTKLLRNGQIFILRGDKTYTLQGQEVR